MFGLFKKKPSPVPSAEVEPNRYKGKPLLILVENYVLSCIGSLPADKEPGLVQAVQKVFGGSEDWKRTLRDQLRLDEKMDENIRVLWEKNKAIAVKANVPLHPVQFAKMIADTNFAHLI